MNAPFRLRAACVVIATGWSIAAFGSPGADGSSVAADARAAQIAREVLDRLGGEAAWAGTRHLRWRFFGRRLHYWDKWTGNIRIESPASDTQPAQTVLMNVQTREGRAWESGSPILEDGRLADALDVAHQVWVNDSYWMFMPYKLLDPGVRLRWDAEEALPDGRIADVLQMTFGDGVGYTPENRYRIFVARDSKLVEQWTFFAKADDAEPQFTGPWAGWKPFGSIWLATDHGRGADWEIGVFADLPASVYEELEPATGRP